MKKSILLLMICGLLASCSSEVKKTTKAIKPISTDKIYSSKINGTWDCEIIEPLDKEKDSGFIKIKTKDSYISNGRFNTLGKIILDNPKEEIHLEYTLFGTGTWEVKNKQLFQIMEDVKIVNLTDPLMDKIFNLSDMFPKNISESSTILSLSKSNITLKSDSDGEKYSCSR